MQEELFSLVVAEVDRDKGALGRLWVTEEVITPSYSQTDTLRPTDNISNMNLVIVFVGN